MLSKIRPLLAALIGIFFYALSDILVWGRIFETNQLIQYADTYHLGWFLSLAGYAALGAILLSDRWKECVYFLAALIIGACSGIEDVLYYFLDHKPMPESPPWLSGNPLILGSSRAAVIGSGIFWMSALIGLYVLMFLWRRKPSPANAAHGGPRAGRSSLRY